MIAGMFGLLVGYGRAEIVRLDEYSAKAALLFNIVKYTDWPQKSFAGPADPIVIGVLGDDPFGLTLDRIVRGRTIHGRAIEIRRASGVGALRDAHLVFVSAAQPQPVQDLAALAVANVMTVADNDALAHFAAVSLGIENNRVVFMVDLNRTRQTGVTVSSKLLKLAKSVKRSEAAAVK